ncbi:MAG: hypothetical protein KIT31_03825 [Deltaproteobacteria bacterium]|nr:hypothetical protein [Deltaproteobacteria bacterium]
MRAPRLPLLVMALLVLALLVVALAACAHDPPPLPSRWPSTTTRSTPASFFGVPGLTKVEVSTRADDDLGTNIRTHVELIRDGAVVCEVALDYRSWHEDHSSSRSSQVVVSSLRSVHFHLRQTHTGRHNHVDGSAAPTCTGYELPARGACRKLFERSCQSAAQSMCEPTVTVQQVPGTGLVHGRIVDLEGPIVGATVILGPHLIQITDEHGVFHVAAGAGIYELQIHHIEQRWSPMTVTVDANHDTEISIARACSMWSTCCAP